MARVMEVDIDQEASKGLALGRLAVRDVLLLRTLDGARQAFAQGQGGGREEAARSPCVSLDLLVFVRVRLGERGRGRKCPGRKRHRPGLAVLRVGEGWRLE